MCCSTISALRLVIRDGPAPAEGRAAGPADEPGTADGPGSAAAVWLDSGPGLPPDAGDVEDDASLAGSVAVCATSGASGGIEATGSADEDAPAESGRTSGTVLL